MSPVSLERNQKGRKLIKHQLDANLYDLEHEFEKLSPSEQNLVLRSMKELRESGESPTMRAMWDVDYVRKPASIMQLIDDEYYFGKMTKDLYPKWRTELIQVMDGASGVQEWIFGGGIGVGKTTAACLGMAILLYYISCLRDPHKFYGLVPGSTIVFGIYSVTKTQALDSSFAKVRTFIDESPYFQENYPRIQRIKSKISFQSGAVQVIAGSTDLHAVGLDMFSFLLDEANFLRDPRKPKAGDSGEGLAYKLYNAARSRVRSRFMQRGGTIPGMVFLVSSKKTHRSFLEKHIEDVREEIKKGTVHLSEFSQWEVLKGTHKAREQGLFRSPTFRVELGDQIHPSRILEKGVDPRMGAEIIDVPGVYYAEFQTDVDQALRDIAGVATYGVCPLFHDKRVILSCIKKELEHPFTREVISLDERNDLMIDQYFVPGRLFIIRRSTYVAKLHPSAPRFVHIDIGLTGDAAGMACVHPAGFKEVRRQRGDGTYYIDKCPRLVVDFVLKIIPPQGSEIDISKMRSFVISLRDHGLPIVRVTSDGFQSRDLAQILRKVEFESGTYSIDRTDEAYLCLRQTFIEQRIEIYEYRPLIIELSDLERDIERRKVDHPKTSNITGGPASKDVGDALAGAVSQCIIDPRIATGVAQEIYETGRPTAGGYVIPEISSKSGIVDWNSITNEVKRR